MTGVVVGVIAYVVDVVMVVIEVVVIVDVLVIVVAAAESYLISVVPRSCISALFFSKMFRRVSRLNYWMTCRSSSAPSPEHFLNKLKDKTFSKPKSCSR